MENGKMSDELSKRFPEETAWLVEMSFGGKWQPQYWSYLGNSEEEPFGGWVSDVNKAVRYARKEDAESLIASSGWTPGCVVATEHVWGGEKQPFASADEVEGYRYGRDLAVAKLSNWMIANGLATGHGDTLEDLLKSLEWQIEELREQRFSEVLRRSGER
jgi:hypothetical protein